MGKYYRDSFDRDFYQFDQKMSNKKKASMKDVDDVLDFYNGNKDKLGPGGDKVLKRIFNYLVSLLKKD